MADQKDDEGKTVISTGTPAAAPGEEKCPACGSKLNLMGESDQRLVCSNLDCSYDIEAPKQDDGERVERFT